MRSSCLQTSGRRGKYPLIPSQQEKYMRILLFWGPNSEVNTHAHTWKILSTIDFELDTHTSSSSHLSCKRYEYTYVKHYLSYQIQIQYEYIYVKKSPGIRNVFIPARMVIEDHPSTWVKTGRFGIFWGALFLQMLCLPGFGTHANTQICHTFMLPLLASGSSLPKMPRLPNRPGFALPQVHPTPNKTVHMA